MKILAVDDEGVILKFLKIQLELEGYQVETALSGASALEKVESERPDLILLDIMMPDMNGIKVAKKLKGNPETQDIPILALTVLTEDPVLEDIARAGFDGYLSKPFVGDDLLEKIKTLIKR